MHCRLQWTKHWHNHSWEVIVQIVDLIARIMRVETYTNNLGRGWILRAAGMYDAQGKVVPDWETGEQQWQHFWGRWHNRKKARGYPSLISWTHSRVLSYLGSSEYFCDHATVCRLQYTAAPASDGGTFGNWLPYAHVTLLRMIRILHTFWIVEYRLNLPSGARKCQIPLPPVNRRGSHWYVSKCLIILWLIFI